MKQCSRRHNRRRRHNRAPQKLTPRGHSRRASALLRGRAGRRRGGIRGTLGLRRLYACTVRRSCGRCAPSCERLLSTSTRKPKLGVGVWPIASASWPLSSCRAQAHTMSTTREEDSDDLRSVGSRRWPATETPRGSGRLGSRSDTSWREAPRLSPRGVRAEPMRRRARKRPEWRETVSRATSPWTTRHLRPLGRPCGIRRQTPVIRRRIRRSREPRPTELTCCDAGLRRPHWRPPPTSCCACRPRGREGK